MKETRLPRPARPGAAGSDDYDYEYEYEYERNGVSNRFMLFAPLEGWRRVEVTDRRTKADWARVVQQPVDADYPHKDRIVLVLDNLNPPTRPRCTRKLNRPKRGASPNGWRFTTLPNMGVGWTWPRLKSG